MSPDHSRHPEGLAGNTLQPSVVAVMVSSWRVTRQPSFPQSGRVSALPRLLVWLHRPVWGCPGSQPPSPRHQHGPGAQGRGKSLPTAQSQGLPSFLSPLASPLRLEATSKFLWPPQPSRRPGCGDFLGSRHRAPVLPPRGAQLPEQTACLPGPGPPRWFRASPVPCEERDRGPTGAWKPGREVDLGCTFKRDVWEGKIQLACAGRAQAHLLGPRETPHHTLRLPPQEAACWSELHRDLEQGW